MIRINLLPHREEKRKQRRTQFYVAAVGAVVGGAVVWGLVHGVIAGYVDAQEDKNAFLTKKIAELDREIDEIKRLREQMDALSSRKRVIESLQGNRFEAVGLMDELAKQTPEGVYLKSV
ncbi:MAG TPA: fimbrial protein, partial [Rhodocyclaceae bacterium]|nr:fimbrial protein [Rhodocyclaceae bacterium]